MPRTFDKLGIKFLFPDNWELDESEASGGRPAVTVYSPDGGFWSIMLDTAKADTQEMAATVLQALRQEYAESEAEPGSDELEGFELRGYDVSFYYVDLVNTAVIRTVRTPELTGVILYQAEDRDFRTQEMIFKAMTVSLLQNFKSSAGH